MRESLTKKLVEKIKSTREDPIRKLLLAKGLNLTEDWTDEELIELYEILEKRNEKLSQFVRSLED